MTCRECRDLMLEVARHRAAPFIDRDVLAHTASCAPCGARLEQERALTAGLRAVAMDAETQTASPDLEGRLLAAFAAGHGRPAEVQPSRRPAMRWLPVAAAVVLAAGAAAWWLAAPVGDVPATPQVAQLERPRPQPAVSTQSVAPPAELSGARGLPAPRPHRQRPHRAAAPVQAVGFEPIPSAAGLPDFESGEIVRLGIPVTALPNYGLEIPSGAQAAVQADLLIGQDGQARAIRLVNANAEGLRPRR